MYQYEYLKNMPNSSEKQFRVLMAGPLPPLVGGMATVIGDLSHSSLVSATDLKLFNTAKQTPENRTLWQGVLARFELWRRWWSSLKSEKTTIVHIHTCSGLSFFLDGTLLWLAKFRRCPVVLHIHGARFDQFLDGLSIFLLSLARWISKNATRVVVLSDEWKEILSQRLPGAAIKVIRNGVPVPVELESKPKLKENVTILFLGNLSKRKGVWDLLDAMQSVPEKASLVLAGGEEDANIGQHVEETIKQFGLSDRVKWIGPVHGVEKQKLLRSTEPRPILERQLVWMIALYQKSSEVDEL